MDLISASPYWPIKNGLPACYPSLQNDTVGEVVVLGAGISGALCSYLLASAGVDVLVLDKRDVASGSTRGSTALLQYEIDTPLTELCQRFGKTDGTRAYQVCLESIGKIAQLCAQLDDDCGFARRPSVYLASRRRDVPGLRAEAIARREAGIEVDFMTESDVAGRFSFSRPAALHSPQAAEVDPYRLTHALLRSTRAQGGRIFDRTEIDAYDPQPNGVTLTTKEGQLIRARYVVFATGYEAVKILPRKVVDLNSTFALISEPLDSFAGWWERCLLWEAARPYLYLRTTEDGRALIGGEDAYYRNPLRRDAAVTRKAAKLEKKFREMFPDIPFQSAYAWAGTFGETKDGLAYIGGVPEVPSSYFVLGFGGNGITYSLIAAEIIRDAITGRFNPDAHLFRFDR